jgi:hypothetical protein
MVIFHSYVKLPEGKDGKGDILMVRIMVLRGFSSTLRMVYHYYSLLFFSLSGHIEPLSWFNTV